MIGSQALIRSFLLVALTNQHLRSQPYRISLGLMTTDARRYWLRPRRII
jgi:hypothetical protein